MLTTLQSALPRGVRVKSTRDFAAGLFMITVGVGALVAASGLPTGEVGSMGPGMLPKAFAAICLGLGVLQSIVSFKYEGEGLNGWSWRGVILVLGGIFLFAATIQGFAVLGLTVPPLGFLVAGPLLVLVAGTAMVGFKWLELTLVAIFLTALCVALFRFGLSLPIPLAPWLLGV